MGHAGSFAGSVFFKQPFFFFFGAAFFFFFGAAFFFFGAALLKFLAVLFFFLFIESLQPSEQPSSSAEQPSCHHKSRPRMLNQRYTSGRCHMLPGNTSSC